MLKILTRLRGIFAVKGKFGALMCHCRKTVRVKTKHLCYVSVSWEVISTNQRRRLVELRGASRASSVSCFALCLEIAIVTLLTSHRIKILFSFLYLDLMNVVFLFFPQSLTFKAFYLRGY